MIRELLSAAQRDGRACLRCGDEGGTMVSLGRLDGVEVFAHAGCGVGSADSLMRAARNHQLPPFTHRVYYVGKSKEGGSGSLLVMVVAGRQAVSELLDILEEHDF